MTALDTAPPRGAVTRFLDWWLTTLASLLPAGWRGGGDGLEARVDGETLVLGRRRGGKWRELRRLAPDDNTLAADIDQPVTLRLARAQALRQELTLPQAAGSELAEVIGFEIDRRTPFRAAQVYADWRVTGRDRAARTLAVALTVVPKTAVDGLRRRLENAGARVARVVLDDGRVLPVPGLAVAEGGMGALNGVLLAVLVLAAVAVLLAPSWRTSRELATLRAEIATLKPEVEARLGQRSSAWSQQAATRAALQAKLSAPSPVTLLEEITRTLPDDTWISQFNLVDGRVEIEGSTASAAALVGLLEGSPMIASVDFQAPVTADPVTKREHFQFRIELAR
ncbi:MAG: PilN domain-containing protein [Alphaproteobacteria bacterium]